MHQKKFGDVPGKEKYAECGCWKIVARACRTPVPRQVTHPKGKGVHLAVDPFKLVRLAGIEPTTPWFVAKYSIQLSYSREESEIIAEAI